MTFTADVQIAAGGVEDLTEGREIADDSGDHVGREDPGQAVVEGDVDGSLGPDRPVVRAFQRSRASTPTNRPVVALTRGW